MSNTRDKWEAYKYVQMLCKRLFWTLLKNLLLTLLIRRMIGNDSQSNYAAELTD
jgi:hypothetical protein